MARKKLQVKKETKKPLLKKKLQIKKEITVFDLMHWTPLTQDTLYASHTLVTDKRNFTLIFSDTDEFLKKCKKEWPMVAPVEFEEGQDFEVEPFEYNDIDLQVEFNRKEQLDIDEGGDIENIGRIDPNQYEWLKQNFPSCVYHQITKWFGKRVNTLVIVLAEEYGKPVAIVKTFE